MGSKSGASEVKQHKWFAKINWGLLRHTQPPVSHGSASRFSDRESAIHFRPLSFLAPVVAHYSQLLLARRVPDVHHTSSPTLHRPTTPAMPVGLLARRPMRPCGKRPPLLHSLGDGGHDRTRALASGTLFACAGADRSRRARVVIFPFSRPAGHVPLFGVRRATISTTPGRLAIPAAPLTISVGAATMPTRLVSVPRSLSSYPAQLNACLLTYIFAADRPDHVQRRRRRELPADARVGLAAPRETTHAHPWLTGSYQGRRWGGRTRNAGPRRR